MPDLSIPTDTLAELIVRTRGVQSREDETDPDSGSNAIDDNDIDALQDTPGDLTRQEVMIAIRDFDQRQQAELVALMWLGRGDSEPEEWQQTVALAQERRDEPTEKYLLGQPLVADFWAEGLEKLGIPMPMGTDE